MGTNRHMHGRIHAKRGVALLIALLMLMMTVPLSLTAFAAEEGEFRYWLINNDSEVKIIGYTGTDTDVTIPSTLGGKPVTVIGVGAFSENESLVSITIPDSVTEIDMRAFESCTSLQNISLGKGITHIAIDAFKNTAYYKDKTHWDNNVLYIDHCLISADGQLQGNYQIKEGTTVIADEAFQNCTKLTGITIPNGITVIGDLAFRGCTSLSSVTIPDSVTKIGFWAFESCTSLTSVTIGKGVTELSGTFWGCTSLTDITIGNGVKEMYGTFVGCTALKEVVIPEGVTTLDSAGMDDGGDYPVFDGCDSLQRVTIPDSVTYMFLLDWESSFTIVCSKDSYAHKFAVENDYPFEFKTASAPGGINVTTNEGVHFKADEGVFPAGTTFKSEKVTSGAKYEVAEKAKNIQKFVAYDITASSNNAAVQPNGTVNVTFAVPEGFDLSKTVIYYISDDGKLELVKSSVDTKTRTITAALTHFSTYAVAETATTNGTSGTGSPQTGDSSMVVLWTAIMLFSAAALVFITVKHRKSVKD